MFPAEKGKIMRDLILAEGFSVDKIVSILPIAIPVLIVILIIASGYVKAPPDEAFIISGLRKKTVIGKSSIKIPFLERIDKLTLQLIQIDVKTSNSVPTADYIICVRLSVR